MANQLTQGDGHPATAVITDPKDVSHYEKRFAGYQALAVFDDGAREVLARLADEYRRLAHVSAAVDAALAAYLDRLRHGAAVDEWLAEMERDHGPVPVETLEWAARLVEDWEATRSQARRELAG